MIKKFIKGKVSVFVDASNVYYSQKRLKWRLDFLKFLDLFKKESNLVDIFYYTGRDDSSLKQEKVY